MSKGRLRDVSNDSQSLKLALKALMWIKSALTSFLVPALVFHVMQNSGVGGRDGALYE